MHVEAIQPFDGYRRGECPDLAQGYATGLVKKGLAKMRPDLDNKMAAGLENKSVPTPAGGAEQQSSASPAAPASRQTMLKGSSAGASTKPSRKAKDASSS